jgi:general secretion pathway protein D
VPVLGDIPILGRLWQGKINKVERKSVLFFVTVKVVDPAGQSIRQATAGQP